MTVQRRATDSKDYNPLEGREFRGITREEVVAMIQKTGQLPPTESTPAWLKPILTLGVGSFLALFLLGAVPGLPSPLLSFAAKLDAHDAKTTYLLQRICINTASAPADRGACAVSEGR